MIVKEEFAYGTNKREIRFMVNSEEIGEKISMSKMFERQGPTDEK
ncbi:4375_t:CDS:2, partial [Funneliformis geosporum]